MPISVRPTAIALAALMLGATAFCAHAEDDLADEGWRPRAERLVAENWARAGASADALAVPIIVCRDTACAITSEIQLDEDEAAMIRTHFAAGADSPAAERAMIARAVAQLETFVGARNGTWRDHARNTRTAEDEDGQMDCISESINTLSYLGRLSQAGLVTRHRLGGFVMRYLLVLQHVAVEMIEDGGDSYVVDSWDGENGDEPVIEPYGTWRMELLI